MVVNAIHYCNHDVLIFCVILQVAKFHKNSVEKEEEVKVDDGGGDDESNENELSFMDKLPTEV